MDIQQVRELLNEKGQQHILRYYDELDDAAKAVLLDQIENIDWYEIGLIGQQTKTKVGEMAQIECVGVEEAESRGEEFEAKGLEAIREGKVGAVLLAGGMGTRLGLDKPKGCLDVGKTRTLYIFECLINNLMDVTKAAGVSIPLYIMTSEKNHEDTVAFFEENNYFGYEPGDVAFFRQDMAVAVDYDGKILMEEKGRLATSPNGNGGWFSSLAKAGLLEDVRSRGVEWLNIFAVDNVLQRICDPKFVGATILSGAKSGSKVVKKNDPFEKVGVLCLEDGLPSVVEYYELDEKTATLVDETGELAYRYGVILNYLFAVDKLEEIMENRLPVHIVEKKIPYIDENANEIKPSEPNGYKFESLAVDLVRQMGSSVGYEVVREKEFAPIKNLHGVDSLDSARELLEACGVVL